MCKISQPLVGSDHSKTGVADPIYPTSPPPPPTHTLPLNVNLTLNVITKIDFPTAPSCLLFVSSAYARFYFSQTLRLSSYKGLYTDCSCSFTVRWNPRGGGTPI